MENEAGRRLTGLKNDVSTYARLQLRLLKLKAVEQGAVTGALLIHGLLLGMLLLLVLLFLLMALAYGLGEWWGSIALGFLGSGVVCGGVCTTMWIVRKRLRIRLINWLLMVWYIHNKAKSNEKQQTNSMGTIESGEEGFASPMPTD